MSFGLKVGLLTLFSVLFLASFTFAGAEERSPGNLFSPRPDKIRPATDSVRLFSPKPMRTPDAEKLETRLNDNKLRSCESREEAIKNRGESLTRMAANMLGKFDAIVSRVKDFYQNKVIPTGKTVPNYDSLLADIASKKAAVEAALSAVPDTDSFDCNSDDPKTHASDFREKMKDVKEALHEYRTSVKNLIAAIHRVLEVGSPLPTATPAVTPAP